MNEPLDAAQSNGHPGRPWRRWAAAAGLAILAALGLRAYMAAGSLAHVPVTTDEAITVLQAKRIREGEWPLLVWAQPYQFPTEAYLSAPLVCRAPRTPWGGRYVSFLEGLAALALLLLLARRMGPWRQTWPAAALILFPSAYLLMIQFGYSLPHNSPIFLLTGGALLLTLGAAPLTAWRCLRFFLAGAFCGLAFTTNMLALPLAVPVLGASAFQGRWRQWPANLCLLAAGVLAGLVPFLAAVVTLPGAHAMVADTRPFGEAVRHLWAPAVSMTLTRAMGFLTTLYPDTRYYLDFPARLYPLFPYLFAAVLLGATAIRAARFVRRLARGQPPEPGPADVFTAAVWLNLAVFTTSARGHSGELRYLVPAALSFPFLLGAVYAASPRWLRGALAGVCVLLAAVNAAAAVTLTRAWRAPGFAERVMDTPDLGPALDYLDRHGIRHCVAAHWQAYRINFLTDERILCSQPLNERFKDWPLPYKEQVDAATNVAYVMSARSNRDFTPATLDAALAETRISARRETLGAFTVFHDFRRHPDMAADVPVPAASLRLVASHNPGQAAHLSDGDEATGWTSQAAQSPGMWIELRLARPLPLSRLELRYGTDCSDQAPALDISLRTDRGWQPPLRVPGRLDPFEFIRGHPVYGRLLQTIAGGPAPADAVRLAIAEPNPHRHWSLSEITVYQRPAAGAAESAGLE